MPYLDKRNGYFYIRKYIKENGKWKHETLKSLGKITRPEAEQAFEAWKKVHDRHWIPEVILGDAEKSLKKIDNKSVRLVVTSPPHWQTKDYEIEGQIGHKQSYEEYVASLKEVWRECFRVLLHGSRLCVNIGDQYTDTTEFGRHKVIPIHANIILDCEELGFDYLGSIIWEKMSTTNPSGGASVMGSYPFPRNGLVEYNYEYIMIFKKLGKSPPVDKDIKKQSKLSKEEWFEYFNSPWRFLGKKQATYLAAFPEELPNRLIKMFTFVGDTVLDPFVGSGTTLTAAMKLQRKSIGVELNPQYVRLAKKRIDKVVEKSSKRWVWEET